MVSPGSLLNLYTTRERQSMTSTPYVFAFSSNDTVLSKLSCYLTRNPSKKRLYIIEETEADVTFICIDSDEETNYFLVNIFLPTRNYSTETPPAKPAVF